MLGKSVGRATVVLGLGFVMACAHTVAQDAHTAEDGKIKGAKAVQLENGEGKQKGIVTYPGGDRVDWKFVETPDNKKGTLNFVLTWKTPRPGLKLSFDVFDEFQHEVPGAKSKRTRARTREAVVENAKGKYFVRVYAVGRGDAGAYTLAVEFKEKIAGPPFDVSKLDIPDPPKLAAVPEPEGGGDGKKPEPCDEFVWDIKNPACKNICPAQGAPPGWPPCKGKCPNPPVATEPACWATMPCPPGAPDEKIADCKDKFPPCNKAAPDERNPNCRKPADPIVGRIVGKELKSGQLILTIGAGTDQGVGKAGWKGEVVRENNVKSGMVPGGEVTIIRVDKTITVGSSKLTPDQIGSTPWVRLMPK
jgi:hypothetical protein